MSACVESSPPGDADHHLARANRAQSLHQPLHLDLVDLVAALVPRGGVGRHVRETVVAARKRQARIGRQRQGEAHGTVLRERLAVQCGGLAEGIGAHAVLHDAVEVEVPQRDLRAVGVALGLGNARAVLVDHAVPVPCELCGRLAEARADVKIAGDAARRLVGDQLAPVLVLADGDVGRREVEEHVGTGERRVRRGRNRRPQVLADLHGERGERLLLRLEEELRAERHIALAAELDRRARAALARGELAQLVELAVSGQVGLWHHAKDASSADHGRAVEEHAVQS